MGCLRPSRGCREQRAISRVQPFPTASCRNFFSQSLCLLPQVLPGHQWVAVAELADI